LARSTKHVPPVIEARWFTVAEIDAGIRKLRRRIDDVNALDADRVTYKDARVDVAESNIRETIRDVFGQNSPEFTEHQYHDIWKGSRIMGEDHEAPRKFTAGIVQSTSILEGLIARLEEKRADLVEEPSGVSKVATPATSTKSLHRAWP
jgi:hypothetical protein